MSPNDDHMELGETGWIPVSSGYFFNKYSRHVLDELGREYDEDGNLIFDPNE